MICVATANPIKEQTMYRKPARYAIFAYAHTLGVIPITVWYDVRYTNKDPDVAASSHSGAYV